MGDLIMIRHGQSIYNLENRFTGWLNVPLSAQGVEEAKNAAEKLKGYSLDVAYTSKLIRAIDTLKIILTSANQDHIPVIQSEALNERNYGELQGLNKADTAAKYSDARVLLWRRSFTLLLPVEKALRIRQHV